MTQTHHPRHQTETISAIAVARKTEQADPQLTLLYKSLLIGTSMVVDR